MRPSNAYIELDKLYAVYRFGPKFLTKSLNKSEKLALIIKFILDASLSAVSTHESRGQILYFFPLFNHIIINNNITTAHNAMEQIIIVFKRFIYYNCKTKNKRYLVSIFRSGQVFC
jgi:hypothetical protein